MGESNNTTEKKYNKIITFIKANKFLSISAMIALLLIIIMIIVYSWYFRQNAYDEPTGVVMTTNVNEDQSNFNNESDNNDTIIGQANTKAKNDALLFDPFAGPMILTGIISMDNGSNIAIIEISTGSFVVEEMDVVADVWAVMEIGKDFVLLNSNDREIKLDFN